MNKIGKMLCIGVAVLASNVGVSSAQSPDGTAYILLNIVADGPLSARTIVFTEIDTGEEIRLADLMELGRGGARRYILREVPAGEYYLSSIYPMLSVNDTAPRIRLDESSGTIVLRSDAINYIGDIMFMSEERGSGVDSDLSYQPNSQTLVIAVAAERELFEQFPTLVSLPDSDPVPVSKELLGL